MEGERVVGDLLARLDEQRARRTEAAPHDALRQAHVGELGGLVDVHGGHADELGRELVDRVVVDLDGGVGLLDLAAIDEHDLGGHAHGLGLVVRDVDEGGAQALVQGDELGAHLGAQLCVEVGERLVHEEDLGLLHHGAGEGHALALAAGELAGHAVEVVGEADDLGELCDATVALGLGDLGVDEAELDVVADAHRGIQGIVLEDHGDVTVAGVNVVHAHAVDEQLARGNVLEAGDHAKRGGLAAARRSDEHGEAAVVDGEVHVLDDGDLILVRLPHVA